MDRLWTHTCIKTKNY